MQHPYPSRRTDQPTDSIVISLIPAEQSKTWRPHYPRSQLRVRRDISQSVGRPAAAVLSSFPVRWPLATLTLVGRSLRPAAVPSDFAPLFPLPLCAPKAPEEDTSSVDCLACPVGRPAQRSPSAVISSVGLQSDGNSGSLSLSLILSPSPHCPSHKFEYSTWPERATARAAPDGGLGLGGVLFLTESEVILSASSGSGKWPGTVFPKYRGENEFKQKIRRQRDVCHRLKSVTRPNLGR